MYFIENETIQFSQLYEFLSRIIRGENKSKGSLGFSLVYIHIKFCRARLLYYPRLTRSLRRPFLALGPGTHLRFQPRLSGRTEALGIPEIRRGSPRFRIALNPRQTTTEAWPAGNGKWKLLKWYLSSLFCPQKRPNSTKRVRSQLIYRFRSLGKFYSCFYESSFFVRENSEIKRVIEIGTCRELWENFRKEVYLLQVFLLFVHKYLFDCDYNEICC